MEVQGLSDVSSSKKIYYYCCKHPGCTYKTIRSGHLKRHERTHTKEKPYCCHLCSYTASRSDHLRRHLKIHFKNNSASNSVGIRDSDSFMCTSSSASPAMGASPVVSASSSPTFLSRDGFSDTVSFDSLGPSAYDSGVAVFLNFLHQCYQRKTS